MEYEWLLLREQRPTPIFHAHQATENVRTVRVTFELKWISWLKCKTLWLNKLRA